MDLWRNGQKVGNFVVNAGLKKISFDKSMQRGSSIWDFDKLADSVSYKIPVSVIIIMLELSVCLIIYLLWRVDWN